MLIEVGAEAPDFTLKADDGEDFRLSDLRGAAIEPFGVNSGDAESHRAFREAHALNFPLLVDEGNAVTGLYGALKDDGSGVQRAVVIVGKDGKVIFAEQGAPPWQRILGAMRTTDDTPAATSVPS
jgi:peroxiredoxin Q/BCP